MRLLLLSCIVCITLSCQQQLSTSDEIFVLDEKELVEKDFLLSDFIDSMIIIPPDTSFLFK